MFLSSTFKGETSDNISLVLKFSCYKSIKTSKGKHECIPSYVRGLTFENSSITEPIRLSWEHMADTNNFGRIVRGVFLDTFSTTSSERFTLSWEQTAVKWQKFQHEWNSFNYPKTIKDEFCTSRKQIEGTHAFSFATDNKSFV